MVVLGALFWHEFVLLVPVLHAVGLLYVNMTSYYYDLRLTSGF
jgi:hypothetical protein